jgi:hypothetical protein
MNHPGSSIRKPGTLKSVIQRRDKQMAGCMLAMLVILFLSWVADYTGYYLLSAELDFPATVGLCFVLVFAVAMLQQDKLEIEDKVGR